MSQFNDSQPIFIQIRQRIIEMILKRTAKEGEVLPSVRQISADLSVNPLTVTKAYQSLVDIGVVESRRGMGMYVNGGARDLLLSHERKKFLAEDWPRTVKVMKRIGSDGPVDRTDYRDWPLFRNWRKEAVFLVAYEEVFGEPFGATSEVKKPELPAPQEDISNDEAAQDAGGPALS